MGSPEKAVKKVSTIRKRILYNQSNDTKQQISLQKDINILQTLMNAFQVRARISEHALTKLLTIRVTA